MSKSNNLNVTLPPLHLPFLDDDGRLSTYWHSVLLTLYNRTGGLNGISSAASILAASAAQTAALAAQISATTGVNTASTAQTSANAGLAAANNAQADADVANAGVANLLATSVFKNSFRNDGIAARDNPTFTGTIIMNLLPQASNDAAAATAGVGIGQLYCSGSQVMQRRS